MSILPILTLIIIFSILAYKFRNRIFNIKRKISDKIECHIIKQGQKPIIIKVNRSKKFFENPNKEDKTKYNINIDRHFLNTKNNITIFYRYGVADPINFTASSSLMLISKDIKNALESKIIQDLRASITDQLFKTMDLKLTITIILTIVNLIAVMLVASLLYLIKTDLEPIITFFIDNQEAIIVSFGGK